MFIALFIQHTDLLHSLCLAVSNLCNFVLKLLKGMRECMYEFSNPQSVYSIHLLTLWSGFRFQFFGSKYQLRFVDGLPAQMQQLVHFPSFIR
jgi:hypothetical protein